MSREIKLRVAGQRTFSNNKDERPKLRLIKSPERPPLRHDQDLKALLDELRSRQRKAWCDTRDDEGPEAA